MKNILHTSCTSSRKERVIVLEEAMRSKMAALTNCSEEGFKVSLKGGKVWNCYPQLFSYSRGIAEA